MDSTALAHKLTGLLATDLFPLAQAVAARKNPTELAWWAGLPAHIGHVVAQVPQLHVDVEQPMADGVSSVVFAATWEDDNEVLNDAVIKIARPGSFFTTMTRALLLAGNRVPKVFHHDFDAGLVVLQRLGPSLAAAVPNITRQQHILARCLPKLWKPLPVDHGLMSAMHWVESAAAAREQYWEQAGRPCSRGELWRAMQLPGILRPLTVEADLRLLAGDPNPGNLLLSTREPISAPLDDPDSWRWIDLFGFAGSPVYDLAVLAVQWPGFLQGHPDPVAGFGTYCAELEHLRGHPAEDVWRLSVPLLISKALWALASDVHPERASIRLRIAEQLPDELPSLPAGSAMQNVNRTPVHASRGGVALG